MDVVYEKLKRSLAFVRSRTGATPAAAIVLGSGLGDYGEGVDIEAVINYNEIEGFPVSTVPGHRGRFIFGRVENVPVVIMQGRVHYYEGYGAQDVVMPIRLMGMLGAGSLLLTNAVGAINEAFTVGDFMLIRDHILHNVPSPLIGANIEELGTRFPDMSEVYSGSLRRAISDAARQIGIEVREGVYIQVTGPNFETPAEIRAYRSLGADVVGMSTACEAVAARHMGMKVCGISCVSNMSAGISKTPLSHEEVQEAANSAAPRFKKLVTAAVAAISGVK